MDISIRKNEHCIIGLPTCDFVFSSTRTCFIAYGFETSPMEVRLLKRLLEDHGIQCEEAGGDLAPGQHAFCKKICSKIITSQFCIVLLNLDLRDDRLIPNANVNMEYGLMLGFNKYLIPFQLDNHTLPFNVAALDTVKYNSQNFESKANSAIGIAIEKTKQDFEQPPFADQNIITLLLTKKLIYADIKDSGHKNVYDFGAPFGFHLLHDFSGLIYCFFGNFTYLRPEASIWRFKMFNDLLNARKESLNDRLDIGLINEEQKTIADSLFGRLKIFILLTSDDDKSSFLASIEDIDIMCDPEVYSLDDMKNELDQLEQRFS